MEFYFTQLEFYNFALFCLPDKSRLYYKTNGTFWFNLKLLKTTVLLID